MDLLVTLYMKLTLCLLQCLGRRCLHRRNCKQFLLFPSLDKVKQGYKLDPWFVVLANMATVSQRNDMLYVGDSLVLPRYDGLREQVLRECHSTPYSAHPGRDKTLALVGRYFWWPGMAADVHKFVKHCDRCQRNKTLPQIPAGKLQSMPIPAEKWRSISMDFITDLPVSTDGYDSIMVFVDRLTKMVHLAPCHKTDTAEQVAWIFLNHVVRLHGLPSDIVSDRDPKFLSNFWTELLQQLHVSQLLSSAFHPQTDGNTDQIDWDRYLPLIEYAVNNSYHTSLGSTPFFLNAGQPPRSPIDYVINFTGKEAGSSRSPAVHDLLGNMCAVLSEAKELCKQLSNAKRLMQTFLGVKFTMK